MHESTIPQYLQRISDMASLLFWWSTDGAPINDAIWRRMVAQAAKDAGLEKAPESWIEGPNYRALAIRTLRVEPEPVRRIDPGILVLSALRHPMTDREILNPPYAEPAAVIRFDEREQQLALARDVLGERHLVWTQLPGTILVATREESLLANPMVNRELDDFHIACRVSRWITEDDSTPFRHIRCVPAAAQVRICARRTSVERALLYPIDGAERFTRDLAARTLGDLFVESVDAATQGAGHLGLTLSAGMDSGAIAECLARSTRKPVRISTVSYGFDDPIRPGGDERSVARQRAARLGSEHHDFDAASIALRLCDDGWTGLLGSIPGNCYRELKQEVFRQLALTGADVVLTGNGGDQLSYPLLNHLWSAVSNGKMGAAFRNAIGELRLPSVGWRPQRSPALRRLAKVTLYGRRLALRAKVPDALPRQHRDRAAAVQIAALEWLREFPDPERALAHLGRNAGASYAFEALNGEKLGFDFRHPFRRWNLVRFVLSLPTYLLLHGQDRRSLQIAAIAHVAPMLSTSGAKTGELTTLLEAALRRTKPLRWTEAMRTTNQWVVLPPTIPSHPEEHLVLAVNALQASAWNDFIRPSCGH